MTPSSPLSLSSTLRSLCDAIAEFTSMISIPPVVELSLRRCLFELKHRAESSFESSLDSKRTLPAGQNANGIDQEAHDCFILVGGHARIAW